VEEITKTNSESSSSSNGTKIMKNYAKEESAEKKKVFLSQQQMDFLLLFKCLLSSLSLARCVCALCGGRKKIQQVKEREFSRSFLLSVCVFRASSPAHCWRERIARAAFIIR
jgi:hypothetical protein